MATENQNDFQETIEYQLFNTVLALLGLDVELTKTRVFSKLGTQGFTPLRFTTFSMVNERMVNIGITTTTTNLLLTLTKQELGIDIYLTDLITTGRTHLLTLQPNTSPETTEPVD